MAILSNLVQKMNLGNIPGPSDLLLKNFFTQMAIETLKIDSLCFTQCKSVKPIDAVCLQVIRACFAFCLVCSYMQCCTSQVRWSVLNVLNNVELTQHQISSGFFRFIGSVSYFVSAPSLILLFFTGLETESILDLLVLHIQLVVIFRKNKILKSVNI